MANKTIMDLMVDMAKYWSANFRVVKRFRVGAEHYKRFNAQFYPKERVVNGVPQTGVPKDINITSIMLECGEVDIVPDPLVYGFIAELDKPHQDEEYEYWDKS